MWSLRANRDDRQTEGLLSAEEICATLFAQDEFVVYVLRIDKQGEIVFEDANDGVARLAGRPLAQIRGHTPTECLPAEIGQCLVDHVAQCLETNESLTYERTLELPHGRFTWKTSLMPVERRSARIRHIVGLTRDITEEAHLIEDAQHNAALLQSLGIALPSAIYLLNVKTRSVRFIGGDADEGRERWRRNAEDAGELAAAQFFHPDDQIRADDHFRDLAALADGEVLSIDYRILMADGGYHRHRNRETVFRRNGAGEVEYVLGISEDVSEQERVQQEVRDLSARMLTLEIDARRQLAQELHDSTGQHLVAAGLALSGVDTNSGTIDAKEDHRRLHEAVNDAKHSIRDAQREIRVLSYLLHPPHLLSRGLGDAITDFARGFGRRASLDIELRISADASTIDDETALHLFRVFQEALTNVYRHARAKTVAVDLTVDSRSIRLSVTDDGVGYDEAKPSPGTTVGVGLASMRERVNRLGGEVQISASGGGTTLVTTVPQPG